jgi:hypothetical protein
MTIDVTAESARGNPPPLAGRRPPRCPPFIKVSSPEDLLPYLRNVAERPYSQGLHPAWDLQPGERVLVQVDNWHDPLCIAAIEAILKEKGCNYIFETKDRGPIPTFAGHNEVEFFISFTKELAELMDRWTEIERTAEYDKILWASAARFSATPRSGCSGSRSSPRKCAQTRRTCCRSSC